MGRWWWAVCYWSRSLQPLFYNGRGSSSRSRAGRMEWSCRSLIKSSHQSVPTLGMIFGRGWLVLTYRNPSIAHSVSNVLTREKVDLMGQAVHSLRPSLPSCPPITKNHNEDMHGKTGKEGLWLTSQFFSDDPRINYLILASLRILTIKMSKNRNS